MRTALLLLVISAISGPAAAACFGSDNYYTCNDSSGNNYSVQRFGDTTYMQGNNARTGSNWSQTSQSLGGMTLHNGQDADGNSWSQTCGAWGCN